MGIFDEGCMGMYNAIIPDHLLHADGVFKERLSQSALYAAMREVSDDDRARTTTRGCAQRGMTFDLGPDPATDLTEDQVLEGLKMYDAAVRLADDVRLRGHRHPVPAGAQGHLRARRIWRRACSTHRTGRRWSDDGGEVLFDGQAVPHFNEVDECAGLDAIITNRVWTRRGPRPVDHAARRALGRALRRAAA